MCEIKTLKESVKETILRDITSIKTRIFFFFKNHQKNNFFEHEIKNYELWGPFLFYLFFAFFLSVRSLSENVEEVFSTIIIFLFMGTFVIVLNMRLLRSRISYS